MNTFFNSRGKIIATNNYHDLYIDIIVLCNLLTNHILSTYCIINSHHKSFLVEKQQLFFVEFHYSSQT